MSPCAPVRATGPSSIGTPPALLYVEVGVPHLVYDWGGPLDNVPMAEIGPPLRAHPALPNGANVNFIHFVDEHRIEIRTPVDWGRTVFHIDERTNRLRARARSEVLGRPRTCFAKLAHRPRSRSIGRATPRRGREPRHHPRTS